MGEEPSHPELLDWLATELIARGWSLKAMHRLIVTSATYRQASVARPAIVAADPDNLLLGRQNRRRLDGEAIRDALLAVSGSLNPAMKGPSVFPELPSELSKLSSKGAVWPVSARARRPESTQPLCVHSAQPAISVLRGVRSPGHECELPAPAGDDDRATGAFTAQ